MASRVVLVAVFLTSCVGADATGDQEPGDFAPVDWSGPDGKADFSGVPAVFDRNTIMTDAVFTTAAVDADAVQTFLERSPYGTRSWLASATLDNRRFADVLVEIASTYSIDPVILLARMQVESSLVSATAPPSRSRIDSALGCGCPDSSSGCSGAYSGLSRQLRCAGEVLSGKLGESQNGTGAWVRGRAKRTSDPVTVIPATNATAALYAYTPWVLQGSGGNWLVWNVMRKYLKQFDAAGTLHLP